MVMLYPRASKYHVSGRNAAIAFAVVAGVMVTPNAFNYSGPVFAQQENSEGEEEETSNRRAIPIEIPGATDTNNMGNGNQSCEILVVSPGTIGSSIENLVLSSKIMGGQAGTAHVTATNSSYRIAVDNPIGFSAMPAGGNDSVIMKSSFMGNGDTNFSETPSNYNIKVNRGLTIIKTHMTAERTDGTPFPAGYYSAEVTLRCE